MIMANYTYLPDPKEPPYTIAGKFYGGLVIRGERFLPPGENVNHLKPVPKRYREQVRAFIKWYNEQMEAFLEKQAEEAEKREAQPPEPPISIPVKVLTPEDLKTPKPEEHKEEPPVTTTSEEHKEEPPVTTTSEDSKSPKSEEDNKEGTPVAPQPTTEAGQP